MGCTLLPPRLAMISDIREEDLPLLKQLLESLPEGGAAKWLETVQATGPGWAEKLRCMCA